MTTMFLGENPKIHPILSASAARTCQETLRAQKTGMRPSLRWSRGSLRDRGTRRMTCSMCRRSFGQEVSPCVCLDRCSVEGVHVMALGCHHRQRAVGSR